VLQKHIIMKTATNSAKRWMLLFFLLTGGLYVFAQKAVHFQDMSFEEAVVQAKKSNKIVFVDVQGMKRPPMNERVEKELFTVDSIADFFNQHCISIHVNMNTDEGKKFAPRLAMLMYPVYVFHDGDGNQLDFTNAGSVLKDPAILMMKARTSLAEAKLKSENSRSISFDADNWKALLAKAKKENKLIFLDAYTEWCRPCIMMAKNIFTLNKVADFYNQHFINVSMDMEKGEGPAIGKKYKIGAYPTFLFIDGNGKVVHKNDGYQEAEPFIKAGETALSKMKKKSKPASK
jgi:thiol-disulfide isomerase/thioredoxin